jgi:hypothetical protein
MDRLFPRQPGAGLFHLAQKLIIRDDTGRTGPLLLGSEAAPKRRNRYRTLVELENQPRSLCPPGTRSGRGFSSRKRAGSPRSRSRERREFGDPFTVVLYTILTVTNSRNTAKQPIRFRTRVETTGPMGASNSCWLLAVTMQLIPLQWRSGHKAGCFSVQFPFGLHPSLASRPGPKRVRIESSARIPNTECDRHGFHTDICELEVRRGGPEVGVWARSSVDQNEQRQPGQNPTAAAPIPPDAA